MQKIRYYISGHGLGHASRSCQIINTLRRRHAQIAVEVVSNAHPWFFQGFLESSVPVRRRQLDIGVLQRDSLLMDEAGTLRAYRAFLGERRQLVAEEAADLVAQGVTLVVADIPAPPLAAASRAGVPAVALSNFSWDWIYRGFTAAQSDYGDVLDSLAEDYAAATLLLRLPFYGDFPAMSRVEQLPLVARRASIPAQQVRQELRVPDGCKLGVISFGGFGLAECDFQRLAGLDDWLFFSETAHHPQVSNLRIIPVGAFAYPDLVAAADVVITKPGYGIVSEAIANHTPVLYTPRGNFREQALLIDALKRYTRSREISNEDLRQ
jgi:UDP:flavonoid glycosyltransferase YjiC (YdhE family)